MAITRLLGDGRPDHTGFVFKFNVRHDTVIDQV